MKPRILRTYLRQLDAAGYDSVALIADANIGIDDIENLKPVTVDALTNAIEKLAVATPAGAGLRGGQHTQAGDLGMVGYRFLFCRSLREIMDIWIRYSLLSNHPLCGKFIVTDEYWYLEQWPQMSLSPRALRFCADEAASSFLTIMRTFVGAHMPDFDLYLPFARPLDDCPYAALGFANVYFEAPTLTFGGAVSQLDQKFAAIDDEVVELCEAHCQAIMTRALDQVSLSQKVGQSLWLFDAPPSAEKMATHLGLSKRTFHRDLKADETTYLKIVDSYRKERVLALLESGKIGTKEIAWRLGFTDARSLRRAFKDWYDMSIRTWIAQHRPSGNRVSRTGGLRTETAFWHD